MPWGFRRLLNYIKKEYDNPPVLITENGFSSNNITNDSDRIQYHYVCIMLLYLNNLFYNADDITYPNCALLITASNNTLYDRTFCQTAYDAISLTRI